MKKWCMVVVAVCGVLLGLGTAQANGGSGLGIFDSDRLVIDELTHEPGQHITVTTIEDVTDPASPRELWRGSNVLSLCGVLNLLQTSRSGADSNMPSGLAAPASVCGGLDAAGNLKRAASYGTSSSILIGQARNAGCTASSTPWACCTGNTTGNCDTASSTDVVTYAEGQPYQSIVALETNFTTWVNAGRPHSFVLPVDANNPVMYFDGATIGGWTFTATADGNTATGVWCEYSVRSHRGSTGYGLVNSGGTWQSGWGLNHAILRDGGACLSKGAGSVWQIRVQITIS